MAMKTKVVRVTAETNESHAGLIEYFKGKVDGMIGGDWGADTKITRVTIEPTVKGVKK